MKDMKKTQVYFLDINTKMTVMKNTQNRNKGRLSNVKEKTSKIENITEILKMKHREENITLKK